MNIVQQSLAAVGSSVFFIQKAAAIKVPTVPGLAPDADLETLILRVIGIVLNFVLLLAIIFVIVAGIRLIVSGGEEGEKDKAKKTIIYVIVGIIVVLLARVLVVFIATLFGNPAT